MSAAKDPGAFKTIGELSEELGVAQHILRYWESKFPQLRPLQRAGNRRYYRPADAHLARNIHELLFNQGYTIRGVQKLLGGKADLPPAVPNQPPAVPAPPPPYIDPQSAAPTSPAPAALSTSRLEYDRLVGLRDRLVAALAE